MSDLSINQALRILQLREDATPDEITVAWRNMMRAVHPDRNPNDPEVARRQFDAVQMAYQKLCEPEVMALRKKAWAVGPSAPFVPGELEAFRILGLGPSASYRDIDAKLEELLGTDKRGDFKRAADVLRGAHVQAQAELRRIAQEEGYSAPLRPREFQQRQTAVKQVHALKAILFALIGAALLIVGAALISTNKGSTVVAIVAFVVALACLAGAARAGGLF